MTAPIRPVQFLRWLGRQGSRAIAALVFLGIALPPVDRLLKPYVTPAIFVLLCIAFIRIDIEALRGYLRRPQIVLLATAWTTMGVPVLFGIVCHLLGFDRQSPDLFLGLMLQASAPPMMAAPAFAALMGLDSTLVLVTLVTSTTLVPFTAPLFMHVFIGPALTVSPATLGLKLMAILGGSAFIGIVTRGIFGPRPIERLKDEINGINIVVLFVFVAAVMENVGRQSIDNPGHITRLLLLAFIVFGAILTVSSLAFAHAGRERALAIGVTTSQKNIGLMIAATGGGLPDMSWLYFAVCQFPIYLSPLLLKPLMQRLHKRSAMPT